MSFQGNLQFDFYKHIKQNTLIIKESHGEVHNHVIYQLLMSVETFFPSSYASESVVTL